MAVDFGGLFVKLMSYLGGVWMIMLFLAAAIIALWAGLFIRKKRRLDKPVIELYNLGNGVFDFSITKGGWFSQHMTLAGLWDYGKERIFRLKDNTPVYDVSHEDYRRINGVNGIVVIRNPHDPKFVVPISKFYLGGLENVRNEQGKTVAYKVTRKGAVNALAQIAPVDLRNAAQASIDSTDAEMKTALEKWLPIIALGTIAIVLVLITIFNTQYGSHAIDTAKEAVLEATKIQCGNAAVTNPGVAP